MAASMMERSTLASFIVRIYRVDTENCRKITGLVEVMDGSGECTSFADLDELGAILNRRAGGQRKGRRRGTGSGCR